MPLKPLGEEAVMINEQFSRSALLLGEEAINHLADCRVAVFGIGGVGGFVVEALARGGIGQLDLIDHDTVALSNLNRQIIATYKTLGAYKVDAAMERIHDIAPSCRVTARKLFFTPETADQFDFHAYDYVVDAIDTVTGKIELILRSQACNTPIISAMGAGNKLDPTAFEVADIYETSVCPLAKVMRRELKKRGVKHLKVVYSKETPIAPRVPAESASETNVGSGRRSTPGSTSFVPSVVGMIMGGEVIKDLLLT